MKENIINYRKLNGEENSIETIVDKEVDVVIESDEKKRRTYIKTK